MGGFRNYGPRFNLRGVFPRGIKTLIIACAVVFLGQTLVGMFLGADAYHKVNNYLGLMPAAVTHLGFV
jgi:hypothetical protein